MTYLLDVNLLIALFDDHHIHHASAHRWFGVHAAKSWATCPLTQLGFLRIVSSPSYPNSAHSVAAAREHLRERIRGPGHVFWAEETSLASDGIWVSPVRISSAHISDCYLLALAARHGGKLATFDRRIPADRVVGGQQSLYVLTP